MNGSLAWFAADQRALDDDKCPVPNKSNTTHLTIMRDMQMVGHHICSIIFGQPWIWFITQLT
mgnify:CR=1 FL=1